MGNSFAGVSRNFIIVKICIILYLIVFREAMQQMNTAYIEMILFNETWNKIDGSGKCGWPHIRIVCIVFLHSFCALLGNCLCVCVLFIRSVCQDK